MFENKITVFLVINNIYLYICGDKIYNLKCLWLNLIFIIKQNALST